MQAASCAHSGDHRLTHEECKAACAVAHYVRDTEESKAITADSNPKIIISASGMATGGRVLHHLAQFAPDPEELDAVRWFPGCRKPAAQPLSAVPPRSRSTVRLFQCSRRWQICRCCPHTPT
jgi:metallo-beta-lactamase family protein